MMTCCSLADRHCFRSHPCIPCLMPSHRHCRHPAALPSLPSSSHRLLLFMPLPAAVRTTSVSVSP
uniref:Uncharacterized protein n=1 Tax=Arundo donax TaxID=35708 RepID=A0A0A9GAH9_ARUDO